MRAAGATYTEIAAALGVAAGSLSVWLRDLPVPDRGRARHAARVAGLRHKGGDTTRRRAEERRVARVTRGIGSVAALSDRELFFVGLALYWAGGSKDKPWKRHGRVRVTNSDADLLRVFLAWLNLIGVRPDELTFNLSIHEGQDVAAQEKWWQDELGLDPKAFNGCMLKHHNPRPRRHNTGEGYHGCLVVTVRRSSALYDAIDGWWRGLVNAVVRRAEPFERVGFTRFHPGSSKGRTADFDSVDGGSNPSPGAGCVPASPWLPERWWDGMAAAARALPVAGRESVGLS